MIDLTLYREMGWIKHVQTKRSVRQARRSSYDAGFDAAVTALRSTREYVPEDEEKKAS